MERSKIDMADIATAAARIAGARRVLADLDGCLAAGNVPLPGAVALARLLGERLRIVSNNSTDTAESLSATLAQHGLAIPPERIVLAGETTLRTLAAERPGARVLLAAGGRMPDLAEALGLVRDETRPEVVALCRDTGFSYERLQAIAQALAAGAELWAANPDLTHPGPGGRPVPETGALLAAVRAVAPEGCRPRVFGKPEPALYRAGLGDVPPGAAVMLGDNPATDIAGAAALGLPAVLLGPHPDAAAPSVFDLLAPLGAQRGAVS